MSVDVPPNVERELALSTPKLVARGRAEAEPEAPPFEVEDDRCDQARERWAKRCWDHPQKTCRGSVLQTFWDPLALECRLAPPPLGGYSGAGCMSGGGGGLSIHEPPESVGLKCFWGTSWNGCACDCDYGGTWDAAARRCE